MNPIVTISGGGIIGNYISSRLSKNNIESIVIEKSTEEAKNKNYIRTLTLNSFSKKLIDDLGIQIPLAKIKKINVFDGEGTGKINFSSSEVGEDNLSYVAFFDELQHELNKKAYQRIIHGVQIKDISEDSNTNSLNVLLSDQEIVNTKFVAGCDGRKSKVAEISSFKEITGNYHQTAITFTAKCSLKEVNLAYQIFSEKGIFAIMPLPANNTDSTHTIVWSVNDKRLVNSDINNYVHKNIAFFEKQLFTKIEISSDILSFKLFNHHVKEYMTGSIVLIGDAAHSIHPLAGQGINLGFADADAFCEEIIKGYEKSNNINQKLVLKRYEIRRKNMNLLMLKSMDFFVNLFRSENLYIKLLRNFGLSSVNKNQFLKRFFINHASGKNKI